MPADHAIAGYAQLLHPKIVTAVLDQHIDFFKAFGVKKHLEPLSSRELSLRVLPGPAFLAAARHRAGPAPAQFLEFLLKSHPAPSPLHSSQAMMELAGRLGSYFTLAVRPEKNRARAAISGSAERTWAAS